MSPEASQEATPEEGGGSRCLEGAQEDSRSLGGLDTSWIPVGYQLETQLETQLGTSLLRCSLKSALCTCVSNELNKRRPCQFCVATRISQNTLRGRFPTGFPTGIQLVSNWYPTGIQLGATHQATTNPPGPPPAPSSLLPPSFSPLPLLPPPRWVGGVESGRPLAVEMRVCLGKLLLSLQGEVLYETKKAPAKTKSDHGMGYLFLSKDFVVSVSPGLRTGPTRTYTDLQGCTTTFKDCTDLQALTRTFLSSVFFCAVGGPTLHGEGTDFVF